MLASECAGEASGFELNTPPGRRVKQTARTVAVLSLLVFACLVPFARVPLMPVPAFVPIYESALVLNDLFTAGLLLGQVVITRSRALLVLACGYLFTALLTVGHMLTFPGLFAAQGLLGAGQQSTAWIYMFWHAGFPLSVLAYAFLRDRAGATPPQRVSLRMIGLVIGVPAAIGAQAALGSLTRPKRDSIAPLDAAKRLPIARYDSDHPTTPSERTRAMPASRPITLRSDGTSYAPSPRLCES